MQMALGDISSLKETESNSHLLQIFELNNPSIHFFIFDLLYHLPSLSSFINLEKKNKIK